MMKRIAAVATHILPKAIKARKRRIEPAISAPQPGDLISIKSRNTPNMRSNELTIGLNKKLRKKT